MKKITTPAFLVTALAAAIILSFFAAVFEAHLINVVAQVDGDISVTPTELEFLTVFPQEGLYKTFEIDLGPAATEADYVIRQKPKCVDLSGNHPRVLEVNGSFVCPSGSVMMPLLCPYLSKHEQTGDGTSGENDSSGIAAFHGLPVPWNVQTSINTQVEGKLSRLSEDLSDQWNIDLKVPCFKGRCAQDWPNFVVTESGNPNIDPNLYKADPANEHKIFGCDLWVNYTAT